NGAGARRARVHRAAERADGGSAGGGRRRTPAGGAARAGAGGRVGRSAAARLEPQVKSFAREERQTAASAKKSATDMNVAIAADAIKTADSASRAAEA